LQGCADMVGGGVHQHCQLLILLRVSQQCGRSQSGPGGVESCHHRRRSVDRRRCLGAAPCRVGEGPQDPCRRRHEPSIEVEHS
ncbi:MAG: hypothetical protein ACK56I_15200, partial [bacterium]